MSTKYGWWNVFIPLKQIIKTKVRIEETQLVYPINVHLFIMSLVEDCVEVVIVESHLRIQISIYISLSHIDKLVWCIVFCHVWFKCNRTYIWFSNLVISQWLVLMFGFEFLCIVQSGSCLLLWGFLKKYSKVTKYLH